MAGAALEGDFGHESILMNVFNAVSRVAVLTIWQFLVGFGSSDVVNACSIFFVDPLVAGCTCCRYILVVNRRLFYLTIQDVMLAMTIGTDCAGQKPLSNQTFSMDTAGIVNKDINFRDF